MAVDEKSSGNLNCPLYKQNSFFLKEDGGLPKGVDTVEPCEHI